MTTFIDTGVGSFIRTKEVIGIPGSQHKRWIIRKVEGCTLTVAPWTWVARVISWNPCNDLDLAVGVFE